MSPASGRIRLLIVDDHPVVHDGLRAAFGQEPDVEVVGEAGNGAEAVERVGDLAVDVVLAHGPAGRSRPHPAEYQAQRPCRPHDI